MDRDQDLKEAFQALTPGRQRSYLIHIAGAKQAKTRLARIERCRDKIFEGKGFSEY
ncbi:YdeI/OmpD-associated family protein [Natronospirillum operosum]|uniref:YdeI/OmpD-associated family protein n=1 Tax=Natronospirillum operosum TaxID=2759953 RepID=UPI00197B21DE|nr:YdeI/OmpD-associated family protein [Natronospirillum operosum]